MRVSATVTRAAPQRTHQRAMARPEWPRPRIKMLWPCISSSGRRGDTGLCSVSSARSAGSPFTCAEPSASSSFGVTGAGASSAKIRATKSAASRAAVKVLGKALPVDIGDAGATSTGSTGISACTFASGTEPTSDTPSFTGASTSTAASVGSMASSLERMSSCGFIAASRLTSPPGTGAW